MTKETSARIRILGFVDYFLPGYKGGGPVQSVSRIADLLREDADFRVFTRDHDLGEPKPYPEVRSGEWNGPVFYASGRDIDLRTILRVVREAQPQIVYLNSYFSRMTRCVLFLKRIGLMPRIRILVAPRGEFSPGALALKGWKKQAYLKLAKRLSLHSGIRWHVSSKHEEADVHRAVGASCDCFVKPPDLCVEDVSIPDRAPKSAGNASFVFLSRISPKKNLLGAIELLSQCNGEAHLSILGPVEDADYMAECQQAIKALPANITCEFLGPIPPSEVLLRLSQFDFFLFPTLGENFGHVIAEALRAGCPPILSDQTPWLDLESHGAGWALPLADQPLWQSVLQSCIDMDETARSKLAEQAQAFVRGHSDAKVSRAKTLEMMLWALGDKPLQFGEADDCRNAA